jgi:putative hemolysin
MLEITVIIICLIINAFLAGSETSFIALNRQTLRSLIKNGDEKAKLLLRLRETPERTLSVIQIGITFVGAFAAAIGGAGAEESISPWMIETFGIGDSLAEILSILLVVIPLTYASVVFGELVPKTLALRRPIFVARLTAPWLNFIGRCMGPIISIFEVSIKKILDFFPKSHTASEEKDAPSIEDMVSLQNKQYIMNMVKIEGTLIKEIFLEWKEVAFIEESNSLADVESVLLASGHTRLPIVKNGKVIGILNSKEFFAFVKTGKSEWLTLCRPAVSVQETTTILTALRLLQQEKAHMAIVYKGADKTGIVTMEAIFEEIIGDIYDEDDDGAIQKILSMKKH